MRWAIVAFVAAFIAYTLALLGVMTAIEYGDTPAAIGGGIATVAAVIAMVVSVMIAGKGKQ